MDMQVEDTREQQNHEFCPNNTSRIPVVTPFIVPVVYKANQPQLLAIMQFSRQAGKKQLFSSHQTERGPLLHAGQSRPLEEYAFCTCCPLELIQARTDHMMQSKLTPSSSLLLILLLLCRPGYSRPGKVISSEKSPRSCACMKS